MFENQWSLENGENIEVDLKPTFDFRTLFQGFFSESIHNERLDKPDC